MNAPEERKLFNALGRIEGHLVAINGRVKEAADFQDECPLRCEEHRGKIWACLRRHWGYIVALGVLVTVICGALGIKVGLLP